MPLFLFLALRLSPYFAIAQYGLLAPYFAHWAQYGLWLRYCPIRGNTLRLSPYFAQWAQYGLFVIPGLRSAYPGLYSGALSGRSIPPLPNYHICRRQLSELPHLLFPMKHHGGGYIIDAIFVAIVHNEKGSTMNCYEEICYKEIAMNEKSRQSKSHIFYRFTVAAIGLALAIALPSCKRDAPTVHDSSDRQIEAQAPSETTKHDDNRREDTDENAKNTPDAANQGDIYTLSKEKEGEIFNRLKQSHHLKPGLSFIADAPTVIEANPNAGIDKPTKCLTYRIGEDHEDRFVTLEFVHYCPELDKLFEYDPITDDYFEIVAQ